MATSSTPMSCTVLDPSEALSFRLKPQTSPQAMLTIRNSSETRKIAFKVKTTRPMRYLVRPNQGMLGPNGAMSIVVILQQKDCDELLRLQPAERQLSNDKFLVQSIYVDDSFYELVKTKSVKDMADELTTMWTRTDKATLANKKLRCRFVHDDEDASGGSAGSEDARLQRFESTRSTITAAAITARQASLSSDEIAATTPRASVDVDVSTPEQLASALLGESKPAVNDTPAAPANDFAAKDATLQEVAALRKKYDELVAFTVQLTAQRDGLVTDLEETRHRLQAVSADALGKNGDAGLRQRKTRTSPNATSSDDKRAAGVKGLPANDGATFGLFHLLVCAIIFFMIGRYYK